MQLSYPNRKRITSFAYLQVLLKTFGMQSKQRWRQDQCKRRIGDQQHETTAFVAQRFSPMKKNWATYEKEGFSILQTFQRLDYLLMVASLIHVFIDHRNLLFIFAPALIWPQSLLYVLSKVCRWAMFLSEFQFVIQHIIEDRNVFADIVARWAKVYRIQ